MSARLGFGADIYSNTDPVRICSCTPRSARVFSGTGAFMITAWKRVLSVIAISIACGGVTATVAAADATPGPLLCPTGFVCLQPAPTGPSQRPVLIAQGESRTFNGGLAVSRLTNHTKLGYCVFASASFGLPAGADTLRSTTVFGVSPGDICPA
jgi:hypothetical protein